MYALRRMHSSNAEAVLILRRIHALVTELSITLVVERVSSVMNPSDEPSRAFYPQRNKINNLAKLFSAQGSALRETTLQPSRDHDFDVVLDGEDVASVIGEAFSSPVSYEKPEERGTVADGTYW